jgi:hypothetical protein
MAPLLTTAARVEFTMKITRHQPDFCYLEFGRNQVRETLQCDLKLSLLDLKSFEPIYNSFIEEIKRDDEDHGDADVLFTEAGYPLWDDILSHNKSNYLCEILNRFLFVEFFSLQLPGPGKNLVTSVRCVDVKDGALILKLRYTRSV